MPGKALAAQMSSTCDLLAAGFDANNKREALSATSGGADVRCTSPLTFTGELMRNPQVGVPYELKKVYVAKGDIEATHISVDSSDNFEILQINEYEGITRIVYMVKKG